MSSVLEVGCWKGRSTHALLSGCKGPVYAVDHWLGSPTEREAAHAEAATKDVYAEFLTNVGCFPNLHVLRNSSVEAFACFDGGAFDMVFIDGDHSVEGCLADIKAWLPKATKLLCGHDRNQEGVPQALKESGLQWKPGPGSIWIHEINWGASPGCNLQCK
jgi:predicted O-methyltransferase YrrM